MAPDFIFTPIRFVINKLNFIKSIYYNSIDVLKLIGIRLQKLMAV